MNTLAESNTPDADAAPLPQRAINQQAAAMALITLMSPGLDAPAATFDVDPAWRLVVHVHDDPEGFEWWREALGLDPAAASDLEIYDSHSAVRIPGQIDSTEVWLVGYLPLPAETTNPNAA